MTSATLCTTTNSNSAKSRKIAIATSDIRIPRATGGPVLDIDLMTMAGQLQRASLWSDGRNSRTLVKHSDFRMVLTAMKAGAHLHKHQARGTVLIQILDGHVRAHILGDVVELYAGHILSLDAELEHQVEAAEESVLLITIAWPQEHGVIHKDRDFARSRRLAGAHSEAATRMESDAA